MHVVMNGLSDLRVAGSQHMVSHVWNSPQHHVMTLMLLKFVKSAFCSSFDSAGNSRRVQHIDRIMS
jgi:hypothetical protein